VRGDLAQYGRCLSLSFFCISLSLSCRVFVGQHTRPHVRARSRSCDISTSSLIRKPGMQLLDLIRVVCSRATPFCTAVGWLRDNVLVESASFEACDQESTTVYAHMLCVKPHSWRPTL